MSFSFGSPATTTGSTFGTAAASTDNKPAFNFTSPTNSTSAPAFGGFSFGAKTTTAASSLFGSPAAATTTTSAFGASKPLSFGGFQSPPNQTVGSPGFGQPAQAQQNAPQNLSFGGATQSAPAFGSPATQAQPPAFGSPTASTGLFGQPAATTASFSFNTPASGFSAQPAAQPNVATPAAPFGARPAAPTPAFGQGSAFGKPASGGFSFGATTSAPSFGTPAASTFGQPAATAQPQPTQPQPTQQQPQQQTTGLTFGQTPQLGTAAPSFGASTGLNFAATQQQPQQQSNQQQQSATPGFSFGQTTQSAPTTQTVTQSSFSFSQTPATTATESSFTSLFDRKPTTTQTPQTQPKLGFAPTTSAGLNFGTTTTASTGINFGLTTSTSQAQPLSFPTTSALPTTTTPTSLTFSTPSSTATSFSLPATSTVTSNFATVTSSFGTTTSAGINFGTSAATGLTFAKPAATTAVSSAAATSAPTGISLLPKSTAAPISTMPSLTTVTTTAAAAPPQAFASISFAQLEENINKWTLELEEQEKTFINQATQINAWDRLLIANGEKIVELNDAVETVKNEQQSLEHELDFVLAQQKELEDLLAPMEKQLLEESGDRIRDPEREHMYSLAENLDTQLRQMSEDLKEVIEHLNETNRSQDSNDPIVQIGRILNAHMSSMQWIDNSIAQISTKLDQLKATHDTLRRDNERSFQLTYN